jgi:hypothetical protein
MVSVHATGHKVHRFKHGRGDGFLRAIKIHSKSSSGGKVNPEAPCHTIVWHLNELYKCKEILHRRNKTIPFSQILLIYY